MDAQVAMQQGFRLAERAIGPTLGPAGAPVLMARTGRTATGPERVSHGATAARRILGVRGELVDTGMMLARHAAWRQDQACGDGSATAVVMAASAHRELMRALAATSAAGGVREAFDHAVRSAAESIRAHARPIDERSLPATAARSIGDQLVADVAVEAVTRMGPEGVIVARDAPHTDIRLQFVDGSMWDAKPAFPELPGGSAGTELALREPAVLVWDADLDDPEALTTVLTLVLASGGRDLLLVARAFSASVVGLLSRNRTVLRVGAVIAPLAGQHQRWALDDLAALTDGRALGPTFGDRLEDVTIEKLGRARRAVVGPRFLNITAAPRTPERVRAQRAATRRLLEDANTDTETRSLRERLGRLDGGMAIVWVGGRTESERAERRQAMDAAILRIGAVVRGGAVPGAGATYLAAAQRLPDGRGVESRLAAAAVRVALERPAWWLARNAHLDARGCVAAARAVAPERGYDVESRQLVDLWSAGLVDPLETVVGALQRGASAASSAISAAGVVVARQDARPSMRP
jgi:chaperonin GroEL